MHLKFFKNKSVYIGLYPIILKKKHRKDRPASFKCFLRLDVSSLKKRNIVELLVPDRSEERFGKERFRGEGINYWNPGLGPGELEDSHLLNK